MDLEQDLVRSIGHHISFAELKSTCSCLRGPQTLDADANAVFAQAEECLPQKATYAILFRSHAQTPSLAICNYICDCLSEGGFFEPIEIRYENGNPHMLLVRLTEEREKCTRAQGISSVPFKHFTHTRVCDHKFQFWQVMDLETLEARAHLRTEQSLILLLEHGFFGNKQL